MNKPAGSTFTYKELYDVRFMIGNYIHLLLFTSRPGFSTIRISGTITEKRHILALSNKRMKKTMAILRHDMKFTLIGYTSSHTL